MKKFGTASFIAASSLLLFLGCVTTREAMAEKFSAVPFVASDRADTTDMAAGLVTAVGTPFSVSLNKVPSPKGTYAGVLITPEHQTPATFSKLSFTLNGPDSTTVTLHYREHGRSSYSFTSLPASMGSAPNRKHATGLQQVTLTAQQFALPRGTTVDKIVITPDQAQGPGKFTLSDIKINGASVSKDLNLGTKFFPIVDATGSGPLEQHANQHVRASAATQMTITNSTANAVTVYLTAQPSGAYASGANVPLTQANGASFFPTQDPNNTSIGYFTLASQSFVKYSAGQNLNVNIYCPIAGAVPADSMCFGSTGTTFAEVNINNTTGETVDISEVNGVNSQIGISLPTGGSYACTWSNGSYLIPTGSRKGQYIPINHIKNKPGPSPYYGDYGNPGVFPYGCTNCWSRYDGVYMPGCVNTSVVYPAQDVGCDNAVNFQQSSFTSPPPNVTALPHDSFSSYGAILAQPNAGYFICQVARAPGCTGGTINVSILQYPWSGGN